MQISAWCLWLWWTRKKNEYSNRFLAVVWNIFCSNLIHVWFWWANFISPECNERIDESTAYLRLNTKLIFPVEWLCPLFVPSSVAIRNALAKRIQLYKIIDIILCVCFPAVSYANYIQFHVIFLCTIYRSKLAVFLFARALSLYSSFTLGSVDAATIKLMYNSKKATRWMHQIEK